MINFKNVGKFDIKEILNNMVLGYGPMKNKPYIMKR